MRNYVMTKNYAKTFKVIAIIFVLLAVVTAIVIPLSLSQQISELALLEKQHEAPEVKQPPDIGPVNNNHDEHDYEEHDYDTWKSQITPLSAANYAIIGAAIVLWTVLVLVYWLNVVAWLYKNAVNEKMNKSLWPILGLFFNLFAVGAFCIVRDQPRNSK